MIPFEKVFFIIFKNKIKRKNKLKKIFFFYKVVYFIEKNNLFRKNFFYLHFSISKFIWLIDFIIIHYFE
jgi:hypothetical protein